MRLKQLAVIKWRHATESWNCLVIIIVGKRVLGTSGIGKVDRKTAMIFGVRDSVFPTGQRKFKIQLRGICTRFQNREIMKFAVLSAVAKFGVDFNKTYVY